MKTYLLLLTLLFLWSCSSEELPIETPGPIEDTGEIRLNANLRGTAVNTRGVGFISGGRPASALALEIFRADATAGTTYNATYTSKLAATMTTAATGSNITWGTQQYYLTDPTRKTRLIGLYPTGGNYNAANRTITSTAELDGATDVMCSNLVEGSRDAAISATMSFAHLLTRVNVSVKAENAAAITAWGNVTEITITGKKVKYIVTLPTPASGTAAIAPTGTATNLPLTTATGGNPGSKALTTSYAIYGYAMFLPVTSDDKLTFNIKTVNGGTAHQAKTITTAQKFLAGTAYNIQINFTVTGISVTATIDSWGSGNTITENL